MSNNKKSAKDIAFEKERIKFRQQIRELETENRKQILENQKLKESLRKKDEEILQKEDWIRRLLEYTELSEDNMKQIIEKEKTKRKENKDMFTWNVEEMKLMKEPANVFIGDESIFACESNTSREDKIAFVDSMQDGKLSYILDLIKKFNQDEDILAKSKSGYIKTNSLRAWINKNDSKKIVDIRYHHGVFKILGYERSLKYPNHKQYYNTYSDLVDELFHSQLKICVEEEKKYFLEHDEYSILTQKVNDNIHKYNSTFGLELVISSNQISIGDFDNNRPLTIDELKELLNGYDMLEQSIADISKKIKILK